MEFLDELDRPTKDEQMLAKDSYKALSVSLEELRTANPSIEIEETKEKITIPLRALKLLAEILKVTSQGQLISIVPRATELTTQSAAEFFGCSRPHLVKILEEGSIPYTKVGKHRRVKFEDVLSFKKQKKKEQEKLITDMMREDEESGLYDS